MRTSSRVVIVGLLPLVWGVVSALYAGEVRNGGFEDVLLPGQPLYRDTFDVSRRYGPFRHTYGDKTEILTNRVEIDPASNQKVARIAFRWTSSGKSMTYWSCAPVNRRTRLPEPVPILPQLERISIRVKTKIPVAIKIAIKPYGFIYHGEQRKGDGSWQTLVVEDAYETLKKWCAGGKKPIAGASVSSVIVCAMHPKGVNEGDILVDDLRFETNVAATTPTGWMVAPDAVEIVEEPVLSGSRSARLTPGQNVLRTTVGTLASGHLSFWAKGEGVLTLTVSATGLPGKTLEFPLADDWREGVLPLRKLPKNHGEGGISFSLTGKQAWLDDVHCFSARKMRTLSAASLVWDEGCRTLSSALQAVDEAAARSSDLICLPQVCGDAPPETIADSAEQSGPLTWAFAERAKRANAYLVANLREAEGERVFHTSVLFDRGGTIVGKYRKSHRLPGETMDLGDEIPVFQTDLGGVGLLVGTDIYFPEIHERLRRLGARTVVWSTAPFAIRDEFPLQSLLSGRATELRSTIVVARYAGREGYGGYPNRYAWTATWPIGRAMVIDPAGHTVADSGHAGGVATALVPASQLGGVIRKRGTIAATTPKLFPELQPVVFKKRSVRVSIVENRDGVDALMRRLDICAVRKTDIAALGELVWYRTEAEVVKHRERNETRLAAIAAKAAEHKMYIMVGGELTKGFNDGHLFDRDGKEIGYFIKILQTTDPTWKTYRKGKETPVFLTDFGRVAVKICNDTNGPFIDFDYGMKGAELVFFPTLDAGPYDEWREFRHRRRCIDNGFWMISTNCGGGAQTGTRSFVMDPWGYRILASQCMNRGNTKGRGSVAGEGSVLTIDIDLDRRPGWHAPSVPAPMLDLSKNALLRILPRDPNGRIDLLCLRADGGTPSDDEYKQGLSSEHLVYLNVADSADSPLSRRKEKGGGKLNVVKDSAALSGSHVISVGHLRYNAPKLWLTYRLPKLGKSRNWTLWARASFPDVNSDSFYWQLSTDDGKTWIPERPKDTHAVGWKLSQTYTWIPNRTALNASGKVEFKGDLRTAIHQNRHPELYSAEW
ncbi:MAG: carbon-nitrogen hydrolase family protein, partial [Lentisphaeria bacterium]|nr:carbon-nitrogen hydrolase family protein [Lentisphaeria bacterium]